MLEHFISTLEQANIERQGNALDAVEIADLLWLALQRDGGEAVEGEASSVVGDEPDIETEPPESQPLPTQRETEETQETETTEAPGAKVYPSGGRSQSSQQGIPFKTPAAAALRNPLALARALRPLMRKVRSRTVQVLDERATVQQTIEEQRVVPVMRPALERWFEVALVIEESGSWGIWQQTLMEFAQLLARQGAFRAVQVWWARVDELGEVSLRSRTGRVARSQILADPAGRRLVLLASDCTSAAWSDGAWLAFLRQWGARVPVTVLQLLPEVMWRQTALGQSEGVQLGATVPGAVSPRLRLERETWWLEEDELPTPDLVPVPVISLEPYGLRAWARVMAGVAQARLAGYGFSALDQLESDDEAAVLALDGAALFERFWATASPLARRLAALMAATSVTLPIVRLIQQVMVPRSSTVQVAEVFLSGMLELAAGDVVDPERRRYEFVDGVRELLLETIPRWEALSVIEQVSGFVARRLGVSLREFEAMVLGEGEEIVDEGVEAFAEVTVGVLQHLGYGIQSPSSVSSKVKQAFSPTADDISNEQKNNITVLATLLQEKRWEEANLETSRILLNLFPGFRYKELDKKDSLWNEVDRVWSQYSDGKFGFSSQRKLLDNLINPNSDLDIVKSYICSQLGWLRDNAFLTYGEINFSIDAPEGHLPIIIDTRWKNLEFMTRWLCLNAPIVSEENFHTYFVNILISCIYFSVEVFKHFELIRSKAESERGISIDLESLLSQNYLNELALRSLDSLSPSTEIDDDRNKEDPLRSIAIASSRNTLEIKYDQLNKYEREEFFVLARDIYMYLKSWLMKSIKYNRPMDYRLIEIRVKKKDNLVNALDYSRKILMDSAGVNELYRVYTQDKKAIDSAKKIVDKYMEYLILGIKSLDL